MEEGKIKEWRDYFDVAVFRDAIAVRRVGRKQLPKDRRASLPDNTHGFPHSRLHRHCQCQYQRTAF